MTTARNRKTDRKTDRGAILMVVLIVLIALLGLGMTGLFLTSGSIQMNTNINLRNQALVVAEAGIERARGILNNPNWTPPMPGLLSGSNVSPGADEIPVLNPTNGTGCQGQQGEGRGAVMVQQFPCTSAACTLKDVDFPSLDRTDLTGAVSAGAVARPTMGKYTVYIRQDPADCRMKNYTCEHVSTSTSTDTDTATTCTPVGGTTTNGAVVIRSEGVATDGKTRVVLEVTMTPSQGSIQAGYTPLSALCASGASGCDDNSSVQNGIVVNSNAPQTPPAGTGGSGAGGAPGTGGAGTGGQGTGGGAPSTGTGGSGAGGQGTGGSGAGGQGTGGNSACPSGSCADIAVIGIPGIWSMDQNSDDSHGNTRFKDWLSKHNNNCATVSEHAIDEITDLGPFLSTLGNHAMLIIRDLFHTYAERNAVIKAQNLANAKIQECYKPSGLGICDHESATNISTATTTNTLTIAGCPQSVTAIWSTTQTNTGTVTATMTRTYNEWGTHTFTATGTLTKNSTGSASGSGSFSCAGYTSYKIGSARSIKPKELEALRDWVKAGHGIATTSTYYYDAAQLSNINSIMALFNLRYDTSDAAGHTHQVLQGNNGQGVDVGQTTSYNDFQPGGPSDFPPPFYYKGTVKLLQFRAGSQLFVTSTSPIVPAPSPHLSTRVKYSCSIGNTNYGSAANNCTYQNPTCTAITDGPGYYDMGYYVDSIGGDYTTGGRIVGWADEWLTYDSVWNTMDNCGQAAYQPDVYWDNVVRWLGHCN